MAGCTAHPGEACCACGVVMHIVGAPWEEGWSDSSHLAADLAERDFATSLHRVSHRRCVHHTWTLWDPCLLTQSE